MKAFQTLLFLAVIILIGGMAALYWGKSVQDATAPIEVIEEPTPEPIEEELVSGNYLVFQVDEWFFYRLAVDDIPPLASGGNIGTTEATLFATLKNPLSVSGGLTADVYGQNLLLHRYLDEEQDGILSLAGEVVETRSTQWGTTRSKNGRYEIMWDSGYDGVRHGDTVFGMTVTDTQSGEVILEIDETAFDFTSERWELEPYFVDNNGEYFFVRVNCASESCVSWLWMVDMQTGETTRIDELVDLDDWFLSSLEQTSGLLAISTDREPSEDGPYDELLPPTTIRLLDLDTLESETLFIDEARAWDRPWLDPVGNDRYVVRLWDEGNTQYLVNFDETEITEENFLTDGWVLDWVGDWLVVQNIQDSTIKLVNVETKEEVLLETPGERVEYIGSIELK